MTREEVIQEIMDISNDLNLTFEDAAYEMLEQFYDATGFCYEHIKEKFEYLTHDDLINAVWEVYA